MDNNQKEQMKKTLKDLASHTEKAASIAKDKVSQQMQQENVKKAAEAAAKGARTAAKGARHASAGITAFWKRLSRRGRITVAVVAVLFVCGLVSGGKGMQAGGQKVASIEAGEKMLRKKLPESQYNIVSGEEYFDEAVFNVKVGECYRDNPLPPTGKKIKTFYYVVTDISGSSSSGVVATIYMTEDGRMQGKGVLINPLRPDVPVRLK